LSRLRSVLVLVPILERDSRKVLDVLSSRIALFRIRLRVRDDSLDASRPVGYPARSVPRPFTQ
jgi:hypothetical protein